MLTRKVRKILRDEEMLEHVETWLYDGWGLPPDFDVSDEQAAAALLMEARTQDSCVKSGDSVPEYPARLRAIARRVLAARHPETFGVRAYE